jgi:hypothetical protein
MGEPFWRSRMSKEELEKEKLQEEIKEIRWRMKTQGSVQRLEKFKVYPTYLALFISLTLGTLSYFHQRQQYLDQQAKEQKIKITSEMITLVRQITEGSPDEQRTAAINISLLGKAAIPTLVENLQIQHKEVVYDSIIEGLRWIAVREGSLEEVLRQLINSTDKVLERELQERGPNLRFILAHLEAIKTLMTMNGPESAKLRSESTLADVQAKLTDFSRRIENNETLSPEEKEMLLEVIKSASL